MDNKSKYGIFIAVLFIIYIGVMVIDSGQDRFTASNLSQKSLYEADMSSCSLTTGEDGLLVLTIPPAFVGEVTQEELNETCKKMGYTSITLNEDQSATYILTEEQHKEMVDNLYQGIHAKIDSMRENDDYPHFLKLSCNEDYTQFTVYLTGASLNGDEAVSTTVFSMYSMMYNAFLGIQEAPLHIDYIDARDNTIVYSFDAEDAKNANSEE